MSVEEDFKKWWDEQMEKGDTVVVGDTALKPSFYQPETLSFRVPKELGDKIKAQIGKKGDSLSEVLRTMAKEWVSGLES